MFGRRVRSRVRRGGVMNSSANRIGLALSGGGFRASLYHLGLVRFLRDAGILPRITHITSVSGGSIFAAHLVLNWDRYNGSPGEFDAAAAEFLVLHAARRPQPDRPPLPPGAAAPRAAPAAGPLEPQADPHGAAGILLREVPLRGYQPVRAARDARVAPPLHQPERGLPVLVRPGRPADGAPAAGQQVPHRPHPDRPGDGADGGHRLVRLPRVLPAPGADRRGRRRRRRRVRPAGVHRRRRLRQPRRPHVRPPGTAAPGREPPVARRLLRLPGVHRGAEGGQPVRPGGTAGPARADAAGRAEAIEPAHAHRRRHVGRGGVPGRRRARAGGDPAPIDSLAGCRRRRRRRRRAVPPLGPDAPLPLPPRAALRRPEARRPQRGGAPACQPSRAGASWMAAISSG